MSDERIKAYEDKIKKSIDYLAEEYQAIRAGRANPHLLDKIRVDYNGTTCYASGDFVTPAVSGS